MIAVVDTETTGLDAACASIVEIAIVTMNESGAIRNKFNSLIRPRHPIEVEAMAVHHITEEDVKDAPTETTVMRQASIILKQLSKKGPVNGQGKINCFVAHNAAFDSSFLPAWSPWLCTWRLAQHLWPEAPRHSNSVLRYWLPGLDREIKDHVVEGVTTGRGGHPIDLPPHRALPDAWVTAHIFRRMLALRSLPELVELSGTPVLLRTCHMGEYAGKPWAEVPKSFLQWLLSKGPKRPNPRGGRDIGFPEDIRFTASHYLTSQG